MRFVLLHLALAAGLPCLSANAAAHDSDSEPGDDGGRIKACRPFEVGNPDGSAAPISPPSGANYGQGTYARGSGLAKLIYLKDSGLMLPESSRIIDSALAAHTRDIAKIFIPYNTINAQLLNAVKTACQYQADHAMAGAYGTTKCAVAFERLTKEAADPNYSGGVSHWFKPHVNLMPGPLSVRVLIGTPARENSLTAKFEAVTQHVKCAAYGFQLGH